MHLFHCYHKHKEIHTLVKTHGNFESTFKYYLIHECCKCQYSKKKFIKDEFELLILGINYRTSQLNTSLGNNYVK